MRGSNTGGLVHDDHRQDGNGDHETGGSDGDSADDGKSNSGGWGQMEGWIDGWMDARVEAGKPALVDVKSRGGYWVPIVEQPKQASSKLLQAPGPQGRERYGAAGFNPTCTGATALVCIRGVPNDGIRPVFCHHVISASNLHGTALYTSRPRSKVDRAFFHMASTSFEAAVVSGGRHQWSPGRLNGYWMSFGIVALRLAPRIVVHMCRALLQYIANIGSIWSTMHRLQLTRLRSNCSRCDARNDMILNKHRQTGIKSNSKRCTQS